MGGQHAPVHQTTQVDPQLEGAGEGVHGSAAFAGGKGVQLKAQGQAGPSYRYNIHCDRLVLQAQGLWHGVCRKGDLDPTVRRAENSSILGGDDCLCGRERPPNGRPLSHDAVTVPGAQLGLEKAQVTPFFTHEEVEQALEPTGREKLSRPRYDARALRQVCGARAAGRLEINPEWQQYLDRRVANRGRGRHNQDQG